jgi:hypothetical protein
MQLHEISFAKAVDKLKASRKVKTDEAARKWLVSGLMLGEITAYAESWWLWDSVNGLNKPIFIDDESEIPLDFWQTSHAQNYQSGYSYPSGHWGDWNTGRFSSRIILSGSAAAQRSTSFKHLAYFGERPVRIEWDAKGCGLKMRCLEHLIEIGGPDNLSRRSKRLPEIKVPTVDPIVEIEDGTGEISSVTVNDLLARSFVLMLSEDDMEIVAEDPTKFVQIFRATNFDHFINIDGVQYFEKLSSLISKEARKILTDKASSAPN